MHRDDRIGQVQVVQLDKRPTGRLARMNSSAMLLSRIRSEFRHISEVFVMLDVPPKARYDNLPFFSRRAVILIYAPSL